MFKLVGGVGVVELEHVLFVWVGEDRNSMWAGLRRSIETATVKINGEMFISSFDNTEWSVVRWLEWFPNSIMANKHVCA